MPLNQPISAIGMPWFRRETFDMLRAMFEDGHKLHRTYDEWLRAAEVGRKAQEVKGLRVMCVDLDPNDFPEWCKAQGLHLNAEARMRYASWRAYQVISSERGGG